MVLGNIFFNNMLFIFLMGILGYFGGRGLLTWSEYLSWEYESELDTFISVARPVAENRWLMGIAATVPLLCVAIACHLYGIQYPIILYVFTVSLFMVQFSLTDFLWQVIFDKQLALFAILGISRLLVTGDGLVDCLMASVTGFVAFFLLAVISRGGFGGGDVKLIGAMGLWLGSDLLLTTVIVGSILGGFVALLLLITKKRGRREYYPYGPYFAITGMIMFLLTLN